MDYNYLNETLTYEELRRLLFYDPKTGIFRRRIKIKKSSFSAGTIAGSVSMHGYIKIYVNGTTYLAHRLAWLYMTGSWPKAQIDHKNNIPSDNRIDNLRESNHIQNMWNQQKPKNNTSGYKGVAKQINRYRARIYFRGKDYSIGSFLTAKEAHEAYCKKADELHGEFSNYG